MSQANQPGSRSEWPDRIVRLLSRPVLTELPENPVGAIWSIVKETHENHKEVSVTDTVSVAEVKSVLGQEAPSHLPGIVHRIDDERMLRWDLTLPLLLKSRDLPEESLLMTAGRVYRDQKEDGRSLASFHQAEILLTGPEMNEWIMMGLITRWLDKLLPGSRVRVEEMSFELYCDRGWAVSIERNGEWEPVIGWGRIKNSVLTAIGRDPLKIGAVGVGMGLERIACLKYGIDDVRKVESARV